MKPLTLERYRDIFGFPVKDYYLKLGFDLEKESFEKCGMEFINEYKKRQYEAALHPGAINILRILQQRGITHSILSAQHQILLDDLNTPGFIAKIHQPRDKQRTTNYIYAINSPVQA